MKVRVPGSHGSARGAPRCRYTFMVSALLAIALTGCAISPQQLCAPHAPGTWQYLGPDKALASLLGEELPHAPYTTNKGEAVRSVRHVFFRGGEQQLLACTLARGAGNDCSVRTTSFQRIDNVWVKGGEDAVLCNVLAATHDKGMERARKIGARPRSSHNDHQCS